MADATDLKQIEQKLQTTKVKKEISQTLASSLAAGLEELKKYMASLFSSSASSAGNLITASLVKFEKLWNKIRCPTC